MALESPLGEFKNHQPGLTSPARTFQAITPTNGAALSPTPRALFIGVGGDVKVTGLDGTAVVFKNVPSGAVLPVTAKTVEATSTTATDIVGLN